MKSEKVNNDGRERAGRGGRPVKGAAEKLKYRITVKMVTEDYWQGRDNLLSGHSHVRNPSGKDGLPCL